MKSVNNSSDKQIGDIRNFLTCIISRNIGSMELLLNALKSSLNSHSRCATKWHAKHVAYRCQTCAITIQSCICVDCFNHSNHEGHDYTLYSSELGGCCDCGDSKAFQTQGFCSRHNGLMTFDLPKGIEEQDMIPVIRAVLCNLMFYFHEQQRMCLCSINVQNTHYFLCSSRL